MAKALGFLKAIVGSLGAQFVSKFCMFVCSALVRSVLGFASDVHSKSVAIGLGKLDKVQGHYF